MRARLAAAAGVFALCACGDAYDEQYLEPGVGAVLIETVTVDSRAVQILAPSMPEPRDPRLPVAIMGYVKGAAPTHLVVFCHGLNQDATVVWRPHVQRTVSNHPQAVALATNYRDNEAFPIGLGAHDVVAATQMALARFPSVKTVILFGVSMGGAIAGTAITESTYVTTDGSGLFDYWVAAEPLSMLLESYLEARVALPEIAADIEEDAGGTPQEVPQEYERRSPALNTKAMADAGLVALAVAHSVNDGLVPYNQGRELALAAAGAGIATQFHTVLRVAEDQAPGNTLTGALGGAAGAEGDPAADLNLSGHGYEGDAGHPIMRTAFRLMAQIIEGSYDQSAPYFEYVVDDGGI